MSQILYLRVLLDLLWSLERLMPDGEGLELARGIKDTALASGQRDAFCRRRPLYVICSGFDDLKPKDCEEANSSMVFPKPMSLDELASGLVRMLSSRQAV